MRWDSLLKVSKFTTKLRLVFLLIAKLQKGDDGWLAKQEISKMT
jgi:hypothetical protein